MQLGKQLLALAVRRQPDQHALCPALDDTIDVQDRLGVERPAADEIVVAQRTADDLREPVWDSYLALTVVVLLVTVEWIGRKIIRLA